jgi:hypothetical protein
MATSYFRERARNPYLRRGVAPIFEEDTATAPTFSQPMPMAPEVIERPPLRAAAPPVMPGVPAAFSTTDPITAASEAYQADAPTTFGGKFKDVLKSAALGFLQSAARDRQNPLAAGAGGALAGGAIQAISPKTGRAYQFETMERPGIEDQLRREQERRQLARQTALDELKQREIEAGIGLKGAQTQKLRMPEAPKAVAPLRGRPGDVFLNPSTGRVITQVPSQEKAPTAAELTIEPASGKSAEEIAEDSYQGRGGDQYVLSRLPGATRQLIERGTFTQDGEEYQASPEQIATAQRALDDAIKRQRAIDLQYTRGSVRARRLGGKSKSQQGGTGISRPRSQFNSKKFPGLKFD